ncbi:MAG: DUF4351 domain-containing protein, partial [Waterburya sp.]
VVATFNRVDLYTGNRFQRRSLIAGFLFLSALAKPRTEYPLKHFLMKISPQDRPQVKAECLRLMVTLKLDPAKMQLISGFIDTYLNLNPDEEQIFQAQLNTMEIKQREQIMEITTSWKEEGRLEGRLEEKLSIALRLLNRKLGTLPQAIADRVKSLESSQLDTLTEDLLLFQTLDDLQIWLRNL